MEELAEKKAFVTLKDHKANFADSPECRLINTAKTETGKDSRTISDGINEAIRAKTDLKQWRTAKAVISWFQQIPKK